MSHLYTTTGDNGSTNIGLSRVNKLDKHILLINILDLAQANIGLIHTTDLPKYVKKDLNHIMKDIYTIMGLIHTEYPVLPDTKTVSPYVKTLNNMIKKIEPNTYKLNEFILPNKNIAILNYTRCNIRKLELNVLKIEKMFNMTPSISKYLNRMSSYIYGLMVLKSFNDDYVDYIIICIIAIYLLFLAICNII